MARKTYWKDLRQSFTHSKGRFFSIFSLMAIGSLTLTGLKVTAPNMQQTAETYIKEQQMADLYVMADWGLRKEDVAEIENIFGTDVEFSYFEDVTLTENNQEAIRLYSKIEHISKNEVISGKLPQKANEIALVQTFSNRYQIGDTIQVFQSENTILKENTFTISGFINSPDIWDPNLIGQTKTGYGELTGYGVISPENFNSEVYTLARVTYDKLRPLPYYTEAYSKQLQQYQSDLENVLVDNGQQYIDAIRSDKQKEIDKGLEELSQTENILKQQSHSTEDLEKIQKSKAYLEKSQEELNQLETPNYHVYNRSTLPSGSGYATYSNSTSSISAVGNIFPVVLYLVAALVTFTTMTRFVDEERHKAGIFKALGYTNRDIMAKFVIYGLISSLLGTLTGLIVGNFIISSMIGGIVSNSTIIGQSNLYFYPSWTILAIILSLLSAVFPAYLIASKELSEKTGQLLQAKPPVSGETILLESIGFIWKRLNFTHKVTARNIFRYKQRMFMTIFGVAGSVTLLFAGLGIQSSISGVADTQFGQIIAYDMIILENSRATKEDKVRFDNFLKSNQVKSALPIQYISIEEIPTKEIEEQQISLLITETSEIADYLSLRQRDHKEELQLRDNGAIITEKLADLYQINIGDSLLITINDNPVTIKVSAIAEMYAGHSIYLTKSYYESITENQYESNAHLLKLDNHSSTGVQEAATNLLELPSVLTVIQNTSLIKQLDTVANSLNSIMIILVVLSILLAIVILYNLTNINVAERIRELSTIKVLGFHNSEVTMYIYRETIVLSLVGITLGLISGKMIHQTILNLIGGAAIMFNPSVDSYVYIVPILVIMSLLFLLGLWVNYHLRKVDMLEALKSIE